MMEIRDSGLYRDVLGFDTFEAYCKSKWDMSKMHAYRLMDSCMVVDTVKSNQLVTPATESQARPLARLEPDQQREAWARAVETAPDGKEKIIDFLRTFVLYSDSGRRDLPGCSAWDVRATLTRNRISVFFYARGMGPSPFPCVGCNRGQVPGDHPGDIESVRKDGPETLFTKGLFL